MRPPEALYSKLLPGKVPYFMAKRNAMSMRAPLQTELVVSANELLHASSRAHVAECDQEDPHCSCFLTGASVLRAFQRDSDFTGQKCKRCTKRARWNTVEARRTCDSLPARQEFVSRGGCLSDQTRHRQISRKMDKRTCV